eukprot:COSAG01_NODE_26656_length_707_cov_0.697368_1_plen_121_part_10
MERTVYAIFGLPEGHGRPAVYTNAFYLHPVLLVSFQQPARTYHRDYCHARYCDPEHKRHEQQRHWHLERVVAGASSLPLLLCRSILHRCPHEQHTNERESPRWRPHLDKLTCHVLYIYRTS